MSRINSTIGKYAILFFGCIVFHLIGTWSVPLIDRDEPRFAESSREMIERGNYIVPRFNNQLRLDKPSLSYWAQVESFRIFGENDFAARFPTAVAAALIVRHPTAPLDAHGVVEFQSRAPGVPKDSGRHCGAGVPPAFNAVQAELAPKGPNL